MIHFLLLLLAGPQQEHDQRPASVSIHQLLANPERFDRKRVRVRGYLWLEFEGNGLYPTETEFRHGLTKSSIWVEIDPKKNEKLSSTYVEVVGTFDSKYAVETLSGALRKITEIRTVSLPDDPARPPGIRPYHRAWPEALLEREKAHPKYCLRIEGIYFEKWVGRRVFAVFNQGKGPTQSDGKVEQEGYVLLDWDRDGACDPSSGGVAFFVDGDGDGKCGGPNDYAGISMLPPSKHPRQVSYWGLRKANIGNEEGCRRYRELLSKDWAEKRTEPTPH